MIINETKTYYFYVFVQFSKVTHNKRWQKANILYKIEINEIQNNAEIGKDMQAQFD
jgi:hypothetical protein